MPAALAQPHFVDLTSPGTGPFQVHEFGPRDKYHTSSFAVVRSDDPGKWPWFACTEERMATAVSAALNAMAARYARMGRVSVTSRRAHWRDITGDGTAAELPLFSMVRRTDPPTSTLAAEAVAEHLTALQEVVLEAYRRHGPMTAKQAERLPELAHLGFSTARKRTSELSRLGKLEPTGAVVDRCAVYRATGEAT